MATVAARHHGVSCPGRGCGRTGVAATAGSGGGGGGGGGGTGVVVSDTAGRRYRPATVAAPRDGCERRPVPSRRAGHGRELLTIFFPMWNEEHYIERAVDGARNVCDTMVADGAIGDYELLVIDDASTDRTPELADKLAAADHRVRVVHHPRNRKLGGSLKTGFASARGDLVLYTDADLPFDMQEIPRAVRLLRDYEVDMVSAYRFDRTGEGYLRAIYTFSYNLMVRWMFRVKARDINFAFKLCRRRIFENVELVSEGSFIDAELFIRTTNLGYGVLQIGVDYFPRTRGESTLASPRIIFTILREMFQLRRELQSLQPVALDG